MEKRDRRPENGHRAGQFALITALIVLIIILLMRSCGCLSTEGGRSALMTDTSAVRVVRRDADRGEIMEELNRKVQDGMINMTVNPRPVFEGKTMTGVIGFENREMNRFPQIIEIVLDDTGETLFRSGSVGVGYGIREITLSRSLAAGKHKSVAYISSVDPKTGEILGTGGVAMEIEVV